MTRQYTLLIAVLVPVWLACSAEGPTQSGNRPPNILSVTVTPESPGVGTTATIAVLATDPDGNALTYTFDVPFGFVYDNSTTPASIRWRAPADGGLYRITVGVSDGIETTSKTIEISVVGQSRPPSDNLAPS